MEAAVEICDAFRKINEGFGIGVNEIFSGFDFRLSAFGIGVSSFGAEGLGNAILGECLCGSLGGLDARW